MIRAVLDTNLLVSAAIKRGGKPDQILQAAEAEKFEWLTSEYILSELRDVLGRRHLQRKYPALVTPKRRETFLEHIRAVAEIIPVETEVEGVSRDPKDNPILACAVDGAADYIVTGDPHLQTLGAYHRVRIVSPSEFLALVE